MRQVLASFMFAFVVLLVMPAVHAADQTEQQAETIPLGGPRGASVTIQHRTASFVVTIEMTPVSCFDEATNADVNRTKAECLALSGFCRSSFGKAKKLASDTLTSENSNAIFRGVTIQDAGLQDGKYRLRLAIPEDGIQPPPAKPAVSKPFDRSSPLFTRYGDHEATIDALHRTLKSELSKVVDDLAAAKAEKPVIMEAVKALHTAGARRFGTLRELIQGDNLLLDTTERPELLAKEAAAEAEWAKKVDACLQGLSAEE